MCYVVLDLPGPDCTELRALTFIVQLIDNRKNMEEYGYAMICKDRTRMRTKQAERTCTLCWLAASFSYLM